MFKTRRQRHYVPSIDPIEVEDLQDVVEENDEGSVITRVVRSSKSISLKDNLDLITREEYSLKNLLAAGVGLEQLDTSTLLNPSDKADLERIGNSKATKGLSAYERQKMKEEFEAITAKNMENNTEKTTE